LRWFVQTSESGPMFTTQALQQEWIVTYHGVDNVPIRQISEWRDIPVVKED
jgi:hypothetical protein